jgi:hypothetical protein
VTKVSKYEYLLEDRNVKIWHDNLRAKSTITAEVYLRTLGLYCGLNNTTPSQILLDSKKKSFDNDFTLFVRELESKGKKGSYIVRFKKVLRSWLKFNDKIINFKVNIKNVDQNPTTMNERVPTKEELSTVIRKASSRGRVSIALMAFSGLRPESLGNNEGNDGLRLSDFEGIRISDEGIEFEDIPAKLIVRLTISKAKHQYFTFVSEEGVNLIKEYFAERIADRKDRYGKKRRGERVDPNTPLLGFDVFLRGQHKGNEFLRTQLVTRDIKRALDASGLKMRPYVLRSYFATALDIAESKGLISHPWRMFFMGHKGDIESRYSTNKGRLPPEMIEEMRTDYLRCSTFFETEVRDRSESEFERKVQDFRRMMLVLAGYTNEEIDNGNFLTLDDPELLRIIDEKKQNSINNGHRQKVIPRNELKHYIEDLGWEYVKELSKKEAIVKLPKQE